MISPRVLFVCTANQLDSIPLQPYWTRMDVIRLSGYVAAEKLAIAKNHLWPRLLKRVGAKKSQIQIGDKSTTAIDEGYARGKRYVNWRNCCTRCPQNHRAAHAGQD